MNLMQRLGIESIYRVGDKPKGHSFAYRTLIEKDIELIHNKVRDTLMKKFNLTLRS
jgi:hypothetical protein